MTSGRTITEVALLGMFCVLALFLFPAVQGPYSAVHGPVTALQSVRAAAKLRWAIIQAALQAFCRYTFVTLRTGLILMPCAFASTALTLVQSDGVLRC